MFNWEHLDIIVGVVTKGLFWTVVISVTSIVIGYFIGLATGFSRARNIRILKSISAFYVWIIRSTPILVQALYIYFVMPKLFGIHLSHEAAGIL